MVLYKRTAVRRCRGEDSAPASRCLYSCERTWVTEEPHAEVAMIEMRFYYVPGRSAGLQFGLFSMMLETRMPVWISDKTRWTRDEEGEFSMSAVIVQNERPITPSYLSKSQG